MPRQPASHTPSMVDQVGNAIAKADNGDFEVVWFDNFWAINNRRDFKQAIRAMITAAIKGS